MRLPPDSLVSDSLPGLRRSAGGPANLETGSDGLAQRLRRACTLRATSPVAPAAMSRSASPARMINGSGIEFASFVPVLRTAEIGPSSRGPGVGSALGWGSPPGLGRSSLPVDVFWGGGVLPRLAL